MSDFPLKFTEPAIVLIPVPNAYTCQAPTYCIKVVDINYSAKLSRVALVGLAGA